MQFEFDPDKSASNKQKHDIDFIEAQLLWDDSNLLEIPARTEGEPRFLIIGMIAQKIWSAIATYCTAGIRIISVRRAREEEVALYED